MPTELDHNAIKDQIVAILQANSSLYDAGGTTADRLYSIQTGIPDGKSGLDNQFPFLYVTNANPLERIKETGTMTRSSDDIAPLQHLFRYRLIFAVNASDSRDAELKLDDFQKVILETLEADHKLKNGGAAMVNSSRPEMVEVFRRDQDGQPVQGRIITYLLSKVTS